MSLMTTAGYHPPAEANEVMERSLIAVRLSKPALISPRPNGQGLNLIFGY
jgi:hypothetical protein